MDITDDIAHNQPQDDCEDRETTEHHKVQFFEEELNKMEDLDSGEPRQLSIKSIKQHISTFFNSSYKGLLLFCMAIFSISTIYNLIQIFIHIFT